MNYNHSNFDDQGDFSDNSYQPQPHTGYHDHQTMSGSYSPDSQYGRTPEINIRQLRAILHQTRDQIDSALRLLAGERIPKPFTHAQPYPPRHHSMIGGDQVIQGTFNGENMLGADGKEYHIPPNYASKSKLVEGDIMKLLITSSGSFIYKQISPIEREQVEGELVYDQETNHWSALFEGKPYKILTASVTFYKGQPGDKVIFLIPKNREASWGAVEYIAATPAPYPDAPIEDSSTIPM